MVITPSQIDLWRQAPSEYQNLEFKEAKNQFDREKLSAYCVAIAKRGWWSSGAWGRRQSASARSRHCSLWRCCGGC